MAMKDFVKDYVHIKKEYKPQKKYFNENYGFKSIPVLISGIMEEWNAKEKWTMDFLELQVGNFEEFGTRTNDKNDRKAFKIADYINYIKNCNDKYPYYLKDCKFHLKTNMINDYKVPDYFRSCIEPIARELPLNFQLSWMYIGAPNTYSGLHIDLFNTSAWNGVISGKKIWLFYPPEQAYYLYNGKINPFEPDYEKFPNFVKAKPLVCIQNPGEVVFTPSGWWHAVFNEEGGASITENFINETNYNAVRKSLLFHQKFKELEVVDQFYVTNIKE